MSRPLCWLVEDYEYRPCNNPEKEFCLPIALHCHSYHSQNHLDSLNRLMQHPVLSPISDLINKAFREKAHDELDFSDIYYSPPSSPVEIYEIELASVQGLGFDNLSLAITDTNKIAGCQELQEARPDLNRLTVINEELTLWFEGEKFHLGVHGLPAEMADELHYNMQTFARNGYLDDLFEMLSGAGCLIVLNHPLRCANSGKDFRNVLNAFLSRYGWAVHAFEYHGLRSLDENNKVIDLAKLAGKPLVAGGGMRAPLAGDVYSVSRKASSFADYMEEVKSGESTVLCKAEYFQANGWKLFVRALCYLSQYRKITFYKDMPITSYPIGDKIALDYFAGVSRFILNVLRRFNLLR